VTALLARIDGLRQAGHSFAQIAEHLNREGFYPPKRTERFTGETVARLLSRRGLHGPRPRAMAPVSVLRPHEDWLADFTPDGAHADGHVPQVAPPGLGPQP